MSVSRGQGGVHRRAPAKVNLALSVGPAEPGGTLAGMHPIVTWMHCIDVGDAVDVRAIAGDTSRYHIAWEDGRPAAVSGGQVQAGGTAWPIERDLAVRAHRLLEREAARPLPVEIEVCKRIAAGAGLGGGSSDAAAVMMAVNEVFGLGMPAGRLGALSRELGSDVAYFIDDPGADVAPRPAIVSGSGEVVERISPMDGWLVLLVPEFGCSTGEVYKAYDALGSGRLRGGEVRQLAARPLTPTTPLFNDLAAGAERVAPRLRDIRRMCEALLERPVHITGSGSAMFGIAESAVAAAELARRMEGRIKDVTARAVRLVPGRDG